MRGERGSVAGAINAAGSRKKVKLGERVEERRRMRRKGRKDRIWRLGICMRR